MCDSAFTAARLRAHVDPSGAVMVVPLGVDTVALRVDRANDEPTT